jgi:microcystin-dependent protein
MQATTVTAPTVTVTVNGLTPSSAYYCRVNASNANGTSGWVSQSSGTNTTNNYGALAVATSIDGYWTTAPQGFLLEDGAAVSRTTYSDLFNVIGTTYGAGDGTLTFNLPDSRGRVAVNLNPSDAEFNTIGEKYGAKTEQLSIAEMPSHTHIQNPHDHNGGLANPYVVATNAFGGVAVTSASGAVFGFRYSTAPAATATNQYTGGNTAHNIIQPSIVATSAIKYTLSDTSGVSYPAATSIQGYWSLAPTEYLLEDGSAVSRATYSALFAAIGTTYGAGDGSTTFNLPDSRGRVAVNLNPSDAEFNSIGKKYGEKTHVLSIAELPSHTHIQNPHDHNAGLSNPYVNDSSFGGLAATSANASDYGFYLAKAPSATATNQNTGGGQAFNVIQPSIVKMFVVKY